jgi:ankyrin repeat protein
MNKFWRRLADASAAVVIAMCSCLATAAAYDDFINAVRNGDGAEVAQWLRRGIDANSVDPTGMPVLLLAARSGNLEVVKALAEAKADLDRLNANRESAMMLAAIGGHKSVVEFLIAREAQVNKPGWTALSYAATNGHRAIVELLLESHAYIDAAPENGVTALMMAARGGHRDTVKLLLDEGADPTLKNDLGQSAVDWALMTRNTDIADMIRAKARGR